MGTYNFLGLSAYINMKDNTAGRLSIIRELIPVLYNIHAVHIDVDHDDVDDLLNDYVNPEDSSLPKDVIDIIEATKNNVMKDTIDHYNEQEGLFYAHDGCFPGQTPEEYKQSSVTVDGDRLRIYIPMTLKREEILRDTARYIIKVLQMVFGEDLAQVAVLESDENQVFDKSNAKVLVKNR